MNPDLDLNEVEVITQLRKLREHGWGSITVTVQAGKMKIMREEKITLFEEITTCDNEQRKIFEEVK